MTNYFINEETILLSSQTDDWDDLPTYEIFTVPTKHPEINNRKYRKLPFTNKHNNFYDNNSPYNYYLSPNKDLNILKLYDVNNCYCKTNDKFGFLYYYNDIMKDDERDKLNITQGYNNIKRKLFIKELKKKDYDGFASPIETSACWIEICIFNPYETLDLLYKLIE